MTTTTEKKHVQQSPGSAGWSLYERAKQLIPGGTQLLSKRPENFLPQGWPCYYSRAKGCEIWDLDGRKFVDMTTTGIGACLLGYADEDVNAAVIECVGRATMTTLNVPAEVELAERLIALHPWASRVRYARSGGESMMIAVRIARAATGRSAVAVCGYHGWADWYLAANLGTDHTLDGHLLPGLAPNGVPRELGGTIRTFRYNQIAELQALVNDGPPLAAIVMEPIRYTEPGDDFLQQVRAIADRAGAVLIFDEITSGWRHHLGGAHLALGVVPDIAVFAKSLSNGFPMAAVIGNDAVMDAAQGSFISSTFWTEAIGPAAAIATLTKMARVDLPVVTRSAGTRVQAGWRRLADRHGLRFSISGRPALCTFSLDYDAAELPALRTLLTQEMLERGYLANTAFYPTLAHDDDTIDGYLAALDETMAIMAEAIDAGDVVSRLRGPIVHSGFARLT